jgi:hypothetical protein
MNAVPCSESCPLEPISLRILPKRVPLRGMIAFTPNLQFVDTKYP